MGAVGAQAQEAYAFLSSDNTKLTFYYDNYRSSRTSGKTFNLEAGTEWPDWGIYAASVTTVEFDASFANARPTSCYYWFSDMSNLTTIIGIENLKTDEVTTMGNMFSSCSSLESLDLSGFNTEKVENTSHMFYNCSSLKSLNLSEFREPYMAYMFYNCSSLTSLDLSHFTFSYYNYSLNLLTNCTSLHELRIPASADKMNSEACSGVGSEEEPCILYYPDDFTPQVTTINKYCFKWKAGYFMIDTTYAVIDGSTLTFYHDAEITSRPGEKYFLNTNANTPTWFYSSVSVTSVVFDPSFAKVRPTTCYEWFGGMDELTSITGIENLNTEDVTNMSGMFLACSSLTSLDLSGLNTENVTDMSRMFQECSSLTSLNVSGLNTEKVTDMSSMFQDCSSLTSLNLSGLNTSNVTDMSSMFQYCPSLRSLNLSGFNTSHVTDMSSMFNYCPSLTDLDVSHFDTSKVTYMGSMFKNCSSLTSLDVSGFKTSGSTIVVSMFSGCSMLKSLDLSGFTFNKNFVTSSFTSNFLAGCSGLQSLTISSTADYINSNACSGVATYYSPCTLIYPEGTVLTKTEETDSYFKWKGGYFKENNILLGDVNGDGAVTITDVSMTVGYVVGNTQAGFIKANADVNGDKDINITDVMAIVQMVTN